MSTRYVIWALCCAILTLSRTASAQEVKPCVLVISYFDGRQNGLNVQACLNGPGEVVDVAVPVGGPYPLTLPIGIISGPKRKVTLRSTVLGEPAKFIADRNLLVSMLTAFGSDFEIYDLEFDGNKYERDYSETSELCRKPNKRPANMELHGSRFAVRRVVTRGAPCGSGMGIFAHGDGDSYVYQVLSEDNGWSVEEKPFLPYRLGDGFTIVSAKRLWFFLNIARNNSDLSIAFGGGNDCRVYSNEVYQDRGFILAGISVGTMETAPDHIWDGKYTGCVFSDNRVYASRNTMMFGCILGNHPFVVDSNPDDLPVYDAGTFAKNYCRGAQVNLIIEGVKTAITFDNDYKDPQGNRAIDYNKCGGSWAYIAGHNGFEPQGGYVNKTLHGGVCK